MCLILDTNKFSDFLKCDNNDMRPVHDWLSTKNGKLVYTNYETFAIELNNAPKMKEWFTKRRRSNKIKLINAQEVMQQEKLLKNVHVKSNDQHIIALARASGAKVLISDDQSLCDDFTNRKLIAGGKIYKNQTHKHLLKNDTCP